MKTYKERLPEIDKAIFELGGDYHNSEPHSEEHGDYLVFLDDSKSYQALVEDSRVHGEYFGDFICTRRS